MQRAGRPFGDCLENGVFQNTLAKPAATCIQEAMQQQVISMQNMIHSKVFNLHQAAKAQAAPRLIVAGATGVLGAEVLRRLAGSGRFAHTQVLAKEPMATGLAQVSIVEVDQQLAQWQTVSAQVGIVMFEPPRLYYQRERALWTPAPEQLLPLAQWLRRCGVKTLVVVVPHVQNRLPDAVKRGLANLDEQALNALGFERLLLVRAAQKAPTSSVAGIFNKTATWMLGVMSYMIPASELPVRPSKLAEFIDIALHHLPPGTHVASPELLWLCADQGNTQLAIKAWLNGATSKN